MARGSERQITVQTSSVSILKQNQIDEVIVPAGDRGEQLIANLLLSVADFELRSLPTAHAYIARARAVARSLAAPRSLRNLPA
jgi:hypothetical protein